MITLNPDQRLLIEHRVNHYKMVGPGQVWLLPWQRTLTLLYIGPQAQSFQFNEVHSSEDVPINVTVQLLYQIAPNLFTDELLPKIPDLNTGGWRTALQWQTEYVLRKLLAAYAWSQLGQQDLQQRLERQLTQTLADRLEKIALNIMTVYLIKLELPIKLQRTIVQAEQDRVEAQGRASVLKEYVNIFGADLPQTMTHILRWELINLLHKKDQQPQLLLTALGLFEDASPSSDSKEAPVAQMNIRSPHEGQNGKSSDSRQ